MASTDRAEACAKCFRDGSDAASRRWEAMSCSHRKQFVVWIEEAKRPATHQRRNGQAIPMIERGERRT